MAGRPLLHCVSDFEVKYNSDFFDKSNILTFIAVALRSFSSLLRSTDITRRRTQRSQAHRILASAHQWSTCLTTFQVLQQVYSLSYFSEQQRSNEPCIEPCSSLSTPQDGAIDQSPQDSAETWINGIVCNQESHGHPNKLHMEISRCSCRRGKTKSSERLLRPLRGRKHF